MGFKDANINEYAAAIAPGNDYSYYNYKNGATGRYRFSWGVHGKDIKRITGVKTREEFLKNQDAQDKYFEWHVNHNISPEIKRLAEFNKDGLDNVGLAKLIHERGAGGAKKILSERVATAVAQPDMTPPGVDERNRWESMKSAQFERYNDWGPGHSHNDPPSEELMREFGINPARLPAFQRDFEQRKLIQDAGGPHTVKEGTVGYSPSNPDYGVNANEQRYTQYEFRAPGQAPVNLGTDANALVAAENAFRQRRIETEFQGFDDPTQNVNYVPPEQQSPGVYGFAGQGHAVPAAATPAPDPNFPTRDPVTGRVTPAINAQINNEEDDDDEEDDSDKSTARRIINGIFGNH